MKLNLKRFLFLSLALLLLVGGLVLLTTHTTIFMYIYGSQFTLSPTSSSFPMWRDLPAPMLASMYLFKVLNPDQVLKGAKPELEEVGPYVFTEKHHKTKLVWNRNGTVTYRQVRTWNFMSDLSKGSLEDNVTILNSVAPTIGAIVASMSDMWRPMVNSYLKEEHLFVTKTVREILFDGYNDPLFDNLANLVNMVPFVQNLIPDGSLMDKFAFFYGRNGTDYVDGVWNIYTGSTNTSLIGQVHSWNYSTRGYFPGECGQVRGGAGEFYPPGVEETYLEMFSNDLGRTLRFYFNKEVSVKGINSYEFVADKSLFANGTENPLNACYQPHSSLLPSGVYNSSLARFNAPVFVSQPHFYQADPYYLDLVGSGLSPNSSLHSTYMRVEPSAGVPIDVAARFQLNVLLDKVDGIAMLKNVSKTFFPVLWFENKAQVPDNLVFKMKLLANLPEILQGVGWVQIGVSLSICIIGTLILTSKRRRGEDTSPILSRSMQEENQDESVFSDHE